MASAATRSREERTSIGDTSRPNARQASEGAKRSRPLRVRAVGSRRYRVLLRRPAAAGNPGMRSSRLETKPTSGWRDSSSWTSVEPERPLEITKTNTTLVYAGRVRPRSGRRHSGITSRPPVRRGPGPTAGDHEVLRADRAQPGHVPVGQCLQRGIDPDAD